MNKNNLLLILLFSLLTTPAQATGWIDHVFSKDRDFRPYLQNGTDPQNTQWRGKTWTVSDWAPTSGEGMARLDRFFQSGILADYAQARFWRSPTLYVGPSFYRLSGYDQRRVVTLFDTVYQATKHESGTLYVKDDHTGRVIGLYTQNGLQLQ